MVDRLLCEEILPREVPGSGGPLWGDLVDLTTPTRKGPEMSTLVSPTTVGRVSILARCVPYGTLRLGGVDPLTVLLALSTTDAIPTTVTWLRFALTGPTTTLYAEWSLLSPGSRSQTTTSPTQLRGGVLYHWLYCYPHYLPLYVALEGDMLLPISSPSSVTLASHFAGWERYCPPPPYSWSSPSWFSWNPDLAVLLGRIWSYHDPLTKGQIRRTMARYLMLETLKPKPEVMVLVLESLRLALEVGLTGDQVESLTRKYTRKVVDYIHSGRVGDLEAPYTSYLAMVNYQGRPG